MIVAQIINLRLPLHAQVNGILQFKNQRAICAARLLRGWSTRPVLVSKQ